jgi:hypothetical protein
MTKELRKMIEELVEKINNRAASGLLTIDVIILVGLIQRELSRKENNVRE